MDAAYQASFFSTITWSLLKLMSIELVKLSYHPILCHFLLLLPGASMRNSAHGKCHEEGGSAYTKAGLSLRNPLEIPEHLPPKPESVYFIALCSHLHL